MNLSTHILIGREPELTEIKSAVDRAASGNGVIFLIAGEAGHGKTTFVRHALSHTDLSAFSAAASKNTDLPYSPIIEIFRSFLRAQPKAFETLCPLLPHLAHLLPELATPAKNTDSATLIESLRFALGLIAADQPAVIFLDDLHWADHATLELLPKLLNWIKDQPLLLLCAYRSDEIPRRHPLRAIRSDLLRANQLNEISINSLDRSQSAQIIENLLDAPPTPHLVEYLYHKTQGVPFFLEELIATLQEGSYFHPTSGQIDLIVNQDIPIPDNIRDAILLRLDSLSSQTKQTLEIAAVAGQRFNFRLVSDIAGEPAFEQAIQNGFITQEDPEHGAFRHALTHEAIYEQITWSRLPSLHLQVAEKLQELGAPPTVIADHWLAAKENKKARLAFVQSANYSCEIHAYSDSVAAARQAIELWPEGQDQSERLELLDKLAHCAQISGDLNQSSRAWLEVSEAYHQLQDHKNHALIQRKLAALYALQGAWDRSQNVREAAVQSFFAAEDKQEAALELLSLAAHLHTATRYVQGLEFSDQALELGKQLNNPLIKARALALCGSFTTRIGSPQTGLVMVQGGLAIALENNLITAASEVYQRLASAYEHLSEYQLAEQTYNDAISFCRTHDLAPMEQICLACATMVTLHSGSWQETISVSQDVLNSSESPAQVKAISGIILGIIHAFRAETTQVFDTLPTSIATARDGESAAISILGDWALALAHWSLNDPENTKKYALSVLDQFEQSEESHYTLPALRTTASIFSSFGDQENTRRAANAISRINTTITNYETLAALSHALAEAAVVKGDLEESTPHFTKAIELLTDKNRPLAEGETRYRLGLTLLQLDNTDLATEHLTSAYHLYNALEARTFTVAILTALEQHGISPEDLLGKRAAQKAKSAGLTKRQLEVLRLIAQGFTNQQIADQLILSARTVDMHVSNILGVLNCRSRAEAAAKAAEFNLLG